MFFSTLQDNIFEINKPIVKMVQTEGHSKNKHLGGESVLNYMSTHLSACPGSMSSFSNSEKRVPCQQMIALIDIYLIVISVRTMPSTTSEIVRCAKMKPLIKYLCVAYAPWSGTHCGDDI
jgi:hypothetical protein